MPPTATGSSTPSNPSAAAPTTHSPASSSLVLGIWFWALRQSRGCHPHPLGKRPHRPREHIPITGRLNLLAHQFHLEEAVVAERREPAHDITKRNPPVAERAAVRLAPRRLPGVAQLHERQSRRELRQPLQKQRLMPPVIRIERQAERRRVALGNKIERGVEAVEKREFATAIACHPIDPQPH